MKYHEALKTWNAEQKKNGATKYVMPKKDSEEYKTIRKMCEEPKAPGNVVATSPLDEFRGTGSKKV
jgi:hypothetical protein